MAAVFQIKELINRVQDLKKRTRALNSTLRSARRTEQTMERQGESPAVIGAVITPILAECDALAAQIAADLGAIPMTVWAEEVRLKSPVNLTRVAITANDAGNGKIATLDNGNSGINAMTFVAGDDIELVNPEDLENAVTTTIAAAPAPTAMAVWTTDLLGIDNAVDTQVRLLLLDR